MNEILHQAAWIVGLVGGSLGGLALGHVVGSEQIETESPVGL